MPSPAAPECEFPQFTEAPAFQVGVQQSVTLPLGSICALGGAESVVVEVTDAKGQVVASQGVLIRTGGADSAVVSFTPQTIGVHHVAALFQPSLGRAQRDVLAVEAKPAPSKQNFAAQRLDLCEDMLVTRHNGLLCIESERARLIRPDGAVQEVATTRLVANGDTVWTQHSDNAIRRYVDDGVRLALQPEASLPSKPLSHGVWIAGGDTSVWVSTDELVFFWVESESLYSSRVSFSAPAPSEPVTGLLLADGNVLVAWQLNAPRRSVICRMPAHAQTTREPQCDTFDGQVVGASNEGIWLDYGFQLRLATLDEGGVAHVLSQPLPTELSAYSSPGTHTQPVLHTSNSTLVAFAAGGKIDFEDWGIKGSFLWPRPGTVVYRPEKDDGRVQVLRR
ncbi:MAG: hypothetical protein K1X64_11510 [Myxococcaceae bacterium]|nr:hypothetical protein [Myxococcaceae bacterium]